MSSSAKRVDAGAGPLPSLPSLRFRRVGARVVVTDHVGRFLVLSEEELASLQQGGPGAGAQLAARLSDAGLVPERFDLSAEALALRRRKGFLAYGPNLHIFVVTLRCNQTCVYCHASRVPVDSTQNDMTPEVAERSVDLALSSTSPSITIEFQGGEPLLAFDVVKHTIGYALSRNAELGKQLEFTLVTNLALMDEEKMRWLLDHRVQICTSVDGPAPLHDGQRKLAGTSSHAVADRWIRRINERYEGAGLDPQVYRVEALLTTTRATLEVPTEVVDTYVELGCRALFLRPLDPFGFAARTRDKVGYSMDEYLAFYGRAVDYMIDLNRQGVQILERYASIFLTKILSGEDPNYLDIRSPCGAGIGQVAYNFDGGIYTCDEGRMLHQEGDDTFLLGHVGDARYRELMGHETVRAIALASNLSGQPECDRCAYHPYCGVCPVYNHKTQGSLFGRMRENGLCRLHMGVQDYLFEKLGSGDREVRGIFERWTTVRPRSHYLHHPDRPSGRAETSAGPSESR